MLLTIAYGTKFIGVALSAFGGEVFVFIKEATDKSVKNVAVSIS